LADDILRPQQTALLFFDTSRWFVNGSTFEREDRSSQADASVMNWLRLRDGANQYGMMVAYAHTAYRPDGANYFQRMNDADFELKPLPIGQRLPLTRAIYGTPAVEVIEEIAPDPTDYMFWKQRWDPFHQTGLELSLRTRGVNTLIVVGGATEIGIAATAYAAQARDFDIVIVSDGCNSNFPQCQDMLMQYVFPRMGRVRTTDQVLHMLQAGGV
jgi:ureidoacrylate peracid hydrolase